MGEGYAVVDDILAAGVIVDVNCYAAEGGHFRGEFREAGVVLPICDWLDEMVLKVERERRVYCSLS